MAVTTTVAAVNGKPATIVVTVEATGNDEVVNVHVVASLRQATPMGNAPAPNTDKVTPSAVSWLKQAIPVGTSKVFRAKLSPNTAGGMYCTRATTIVSIHGATTYYDNQRAIACFTQ
jgi:hypothetical protein